MIESRKADHIDICLNKDVANGARHWDQIKLMHRAAPEVDMDEISMDCELLGQKINAPLVISAITGGYSGAEDINRRLAASAEDMGIPLGVGSQRPAMEDKKNRSSYEVIADYDIPLIFGNIGAPQLIPQLSGKSVIDIDMCREALKMIDGDYLAVHFNYLQEVIQPEGDVRAYGVMDALKELAKDIPLIAKETGAGVSSEMASEFEKAGIKAIDIGGMGGTSFSAVEYHRTGSLDKRELAKLLWDWGLPTPVSIIQCRRSAKLPIIATGGITNGLDAAKALSLGADVVGIAGGILPHAVKSKEDTTSYIERIVKELKTVMFLMGCKEIKDLRNARVTMIGELRDWIDDRDNLQ